jgi:hypothetical protein
VSSSAWFCIEIHAIPIPPALRLVGLQLKRLLQSLQVCFHVGLEILDSRTVKTGFTMLAAHSTSSSVKIGHVGNIGHQG